MNTSDWHRAQDVYLSPCGVRRWLRDPEPLNIHVVARTELLTNGVPATLRALRDLYSSTDVVSGFVTDRTSRGVRPVVACVRGTSLFLGRRRTDRIHDDERGRVLRGCQYYDDYAQEVRARKAGYRTVAQLIGAGPRNLTGLRPGLEFLSRSLERREISLDAGATLGFMVDQR